MSILFSGYKITSEVSPMEDFGAGDSNLGWTGNIVTGLDADDSSTITCRPLSSDGEDNYRGRQGVLNGDLVAGTKYRVDFYARETGSGISWNNLAPVIVLINKDGFEGQDGQHALWGPGSGRTLTGTFSIFSVEIQLEPGGVNGGFTPNSIAFFVTCQLAHDLGNMKTLEVGVLRVDPLDVG